MKYDIQTENNIGDMMGEEIESIKNFIGNMEHILEVNKRGWPIDSEKMRANIASIQVRLHLMESHNKVLEDME